MTNTEPSIVMTLPEAAARWRIGLTSARELARQGRFPGAFQVGRMWRVHRATFEEEIAKMARGDNTLAEPDQVLARALDETRFRLSRTARG